MINNACFYALISFIKEVKREIPHDRRETRHSSLWSCYRAPPWTPWPPSDRGYPPRSYTCRWPGNKGGTGWRPSTRTPGTDRRGNPWPDTRRPNTPVTGRIYYHKIQGLFRNHLFIKTFTLTFLKKKTLKFHQKLNRRASQSYSDFYTLENKGVLSP